MPNIFGRALLKIYTKCMLSTQHWVDLE